MAKFKLIKTNTERHVFVTPFAVLSFAQLLEAKPFPTKPDGPKHFKADFIFDSEAAFAEKDKRGLTMLQAVKNAIIDQWGAEKAKRIWPTVKADVFRIGNDNENKDGEVYGGYADKVYVSAKTGEKFPPFVVLNDGKTRAKEGDIYNGLIVRAQLAVIPYDFANKESVSLRLIGVQKVRDGERLGGGPQMESFFDVSESVEDFDGDGGEDDTDF